MIITIHYWEILSTSQFLKEGQKILDAQMGMFFLDL